MRSSSDIKIRKRRKKSNPVLKTLAVIGTTFLSLFLIVVITLCIVATALTVYVIKFMENSESVDIDLYNLDVMTTSFIYAEDPVTGEQVEIHRMSQDANRILVSLDEVPQHVRDAFISTEDERFYEHEGVDFKRTFLAFANYFLHFWDEKQGGSTITQQLVKNITGDDKQDPARKMREIFRAMNLEREYPKDVILEAYLNYIGFGGNTYGIQAAANKYFNKDVSELTVAEAACLAAIPKSTVEFNPLINPESNQNRRNQVVLPTMLENGFISSAQYEEAVNATLIFAGQSLDEETGEIVEEDTVIQDYFVDMVIFDVAEDFQKKYGIDTQEEAIKIISNGGYRIYSTVDLDIQREMEAKYLDNATFSNSEEALANPPQSAAIIMDYNGHIKGVVGGIGRKPNPMCYNRATMAKRSIGSTVKPISSYGYALYSDYINWSTVFFDEPIEVVEDWNTMKKMKWPKNYSNKWTGQKYFTYDALQRSLNTIPAQLVDHHTPKTVFDFMQNNMQITSLVAADADYSAMTVGGLTDGITLLELTSAYQAFGNEGKIYKPISYYKVLDSNGNVVLDNTDNTYIQAIDPDTAYVMNKLLQTVVYGPAGTGVAAKVENVTIAAKTGTSQEWVDLAFVGVTPSYVSAIWYGYDEAYKYDEETGKYVPNSCKDIYYSSAVVWKNVFGNIMAEKDAGTSFPENPNIIKMEYCMHTGLIAGPSCTTRAEGYYKPTNIPGFCNGQHNGTIYNLPGGETIRVIEEENEETTPGTASTIDLNSLPQ